MKKFIQNILILAFIYLLVNLFLYQFLLKDLVFDKYLDLSSNSKNYVLSDSHGEAINDELFNKIGISNLSFASDSYFDIYLKTCNLIRNKGVDTLYITADDHTLSPYRESMNNLDRSVSLANYSDYSDFIPMSRLQFIINRNVGMYLPLIDTKKSMLIYETLKHYIIPRKDLTSNDVQWINIQDKETVSQHRKEVQFSEKNESKKLKECLIKIINLCKKNDIILIGLKFPITTIYSNKIEGLSYNPDKIIKSHGFKVIDLKTGFDDKLFKDQDHLNEPGAKEFIKRLFIQIAGLN